MSQWLQVVHGRSHNQGKKNQISQNHLDTGYFVGQ